MFSMDTTNYSTQLRAGFFLFMGLGAICALVLYFGRFSQWTEHYYTITVEYSNASGLLKGADVLLAGARIGDIKKAPVVLPDMRGVAVVLRIDEKVKIPKQSIFSIGSSGLLGDRFVTVTMKEDADLNDCLLPNAVVQGEREASIADLQQKIGDIMPKVEKAVGNINLITEKLKSDVFNKKNISDIQQTLSNIHQATDTLVVSSKKVGDVIQDTSLFLKRGNETMSAAKGAADDLKAFINNLRHHGIIFYRDTANKIMSKGSLD